MRLSVVVVVEEEEETLEQFLLTSFFPTALQMEAVISFKTSVNITSGP
jgi:hypothetical protein